MKYIEEEMRNFEDMAKGNVAKILDYYYKKKIEVPKEIIDTLDFSEEFKKVFKYKSSNKSKRYDVPHTINETHMINCVRYLDYQAFSNYIDINWIYAPGINNESENNLIKIALIYDKQEVLDKSIDLVSEEIKKQEVLNDLGHKSLENKFFSDSVDLYSILRIAEDFKNNESTLLKKYNFFKKSLSLFNEYSQHRGKLWKSSHVVNYNEWHKNHDYLERFFFRFSRKEQLTEYLVENKNFFKILKDAFQQYELEENPFIKSELLAKAMNGGNVKFLELVYRNKNNKKLFQDAFDLYTKKLVDSVFSSFHDTYQDNIRLLSFKNIKHIFNFFDKNNIPMIHNKYSCLALMLSEEEKYTKEENIINQYIKNIKNIEEIKIIDNLNIKELSYLSNTIEEIYTKNKTQKKYKNEKDLFLEIYPTVEIYLIQKSKEIFPQVIISDNQKAEAIQKFTENIDTYLSGLKRLSNQEAVFVFTKKILEEKPEKTKDSNVKKNKI